MRASACERLARRPLTGHWFRALRLRHWSSRLSTDQSRTSRSRFSAASPSNPLFRILYLGETHQVAVHEVGALLGDPNAPVANPKGSWAILSLSVVLEQVVDLTDSTQQRIIRTNQSELTGNWINYAGVSPTPPGRGALPPPRPRGIHLWFLESSRELPRHFSRQTLGKQLCHFR